MKVKLTAFKAVVNQRLNEHEKAQEFINLRFENLELQNDHLNRDMNVMRESVEDTEEVIQQLLSRVDELDQYTRRECLVLNGVKKTLIKLKMQGWTGMYTLVVPSLSAKFIKNSHQNLPV